MLWGLPMGKYGLGNFDYNWSDGKTAKNPTLPSADTGKNPYVAIQ